MNIYKNKFVFCLLLLACAANLWAGNEKAETLYYGIEQNGVLCGFSELNISEIEIEGRKAIFLDEAIVTKITALGAPVETSMNFKYHVDPETGRFFYHESDIRQGSVHIGATFIVEGNTMHVKPRGSGDAEDIMLPPDVLLENLQLFPYLINDFGEGDPETKNYRTYDVIDGVIHDVTYTRLGTEELNLAGNIYNSLIFEGFNAAIGTRTKLWIDQETGYFLKGEFPSKNVYLADETIKENISRANLDEQIFGKVGVAISDIKGISYLKVKASMEPAGAPITAESLNIPGQSFKGTVKENFIDGIFEISHDKYDGTDAPVFPADYSGDETMNEYLTADDFIESDDTTLIRKARELTDGSADSWEAFKRLSKWVSEEIGYDIPGGGTAKNTYDMRVAECGGHSRLLAAFSRAVGIPCRVVWGCMYTPNYGGSFGQHAWNEVYMGKAGWIPVDVTAQEIDYVDCGHIRLAAASSKRIFFNPKEMELLDYHAGDITMATAGTTEISDKYQPYVGEYQSELDNVKVHVQNGSLALDIPGKPTFELNDPDEDGLWFFKLTNLASVSFEEGVSGKAVSMTVHSSSKLSKKPAHDSVVEKIDAPEDYLAYLGKYPVPMGNKELTVDYRNNSLVLYETEEEIVRLEDSGVEGKWIGDVGRKSRVEISFDLNDAGNVAAMIITENAKFTKVESTAGN